MGGTCIHTCTTFTESVGSVLVRGIIRAARRRPNRFTFASGEERREREGAQGLARPHLALSDTDTDCTAQLCVRVGGGIELVALLTADVRASVPFSSVDRWVRVLRQQVRIHRELGIKTSYMCVVLGSYIYSTALVPVQDASHNPDLLGCVMRGLRC